MRRSREQILEWESRWRLPTAVASLLGVICFVGSLFVVAGLGSGGTAEFLREAESGSGRVLASGALQAVAFLGLGAALIYLFRAAQARSENMRGQLIGLVVVAPLFLAVASLMTPVITNQAADKFTAGEARPTLTRAEAGRDCRKERSDEGAAAFAAEHDEGDPLADCTRTKLADDAAEAAVSDVGLRKVSGGLQLAGLLALAFSLLYGCLNAMRVGLLTRFWGSLGMALGVAALLSLVLFTLVWFIYFAVLLAGWLPGGRPPAWAAGEAVPWPTPGEKAAAALQPDDGDAVVDEQPGEGAAGTGEQDSGTAPGGNGSVPPRKRKQRD